MRNRFSDRVVGRGMHLKGHGILIFGLCLVLFFQAGCKSPSDYREGADKVAAEIIAEKQKGSLGRTEQLDIERPSDTLRRRLLTDQRLPYAGGASLGTDKLKPIKHWPEKEYPGDKKSAAEPDLIVEAGKPLRLSLVQALEAGARNSFEYQTRKEDIFQSALNLDLARNEFRNIFTSQVNSLVSTDMTGNRAVSGVENSGEIGVTRKLKSGIDLSAGLAIDLANLLTLGGASSLGVLGDATVTVPLLRGSREDIVTEPLTQAERNVVYSIYTFERYKQTYAVSVAREYLSVLRRLDEEKNSEENYRGLIAVSRRARRLGDAGRLNEVQVDQAVQNELRARNRWISSVETYKRSLDEFKELLGLPPDCEVELDKGELEQLSGYADKFLADANSAEMLESTAETPAADVPVVLTSPDSENAGPLEMEEALAMKLGLENRPDFRVTQGRVYDAQRNVVVLADALGAELTLFGSAELGGRREVETAGLNDATLRGDKGKYSGLLSLDLPLERTAERDSYRNGLIILERAVREVQILEDQIKLGVRNKLRDLLESRESTRIQAQSVELARKRVDSTNLFLEAGRAQIRDLLEAQEALLSAQNSLTAAVASYRVAELELQSEMGVLKVDEKGLWKEYSPEETGNAAN